MIWKDVTGYEGLYQVSDTGLVSSLRRGNNLSLYVGSNGYPRVCLSKDGKTKVFRVHQLVASAFLNHSIDGFSMVVDHIDEDRQNNSVSNLRITSQRFNVGRGMTNSTGLRGVSKCNKTGKYLSRIMINGNRIHLGTFKTKEEASEAYNNKLQTIKKTD